ncbi:unnamed protein product [Chondrus crispus]|uniref:Uncharacterized protein n=1 Tax=Chondrus crispus TaxID=2769 RepID=R7QBZ2_CHOCR|nr:unnamed protein product [Chondrus crispus]CDF34946.1 unnamed protein product [Chondrus crispus]|eukprot:XP_005714765.1 unnamed protein product [Chondrus crispus]
MPQLPPQGSYPGVAPENYPSQQPSVAPSNPATFPTTQQQQHPLRDSYVSRPSHSTAAQPATIQQPQPQLPSHPSMVPPQFAAMPPFPNPYMPPVPPMMGSMPPPFPAPGLPGMPLPGMGLGGAAMPPMPGMCQPPTFQGPYPMKNLNVYEYVRPIDLVSAIRYPYDAPIEKDLAKIIAKANHYGGEIHKKHFSNKKYTKYVFLAGFILYMRGYPQIANPYDPEDIYVKIRNVFIANPNRLEQAPGSALANVLAGRKHRHRHHHHHHHHHNHRNHRHHHRHHSRRSRSEKEEDPKSTRTTGRLSPTHSQSQKKSSGGSRTGSRAGSRAGSSSTSESSEWEE